MKTPEEEIAQMHFDFADWEKAFQVWRETEPIYGDNMQMVISTKAYPGYWIEVKGKHLMAGDHLYVGAEVYALEERVKAVIKIAEEKGNEPGLIL